MDDLDHQSHERRVLKTEVASADGFKAAVLINHSLDVLHARALGSGCVVEVGFEIGEGGPHTAAAAHSDL